MNKLKEFFSEPDNYINTKFMFIIFAILGAFTILFVKCLPVEAASNTGVIVPEEFPLIVTNVTNVDISQVISTYVNSSYYQSGMDFCIYPYEISSNGSIRFLVVLNPYYENIGEITTFTDTLLKLRTHSSFSVQIYYNSSQGSYSSFINNNQLNRVFYSFTVSQLFENKLGFICYSTNDIKSNDNITVWTNYVDESKGLNDLIDSGSFFIGSGVPYELPTPDLPDTTTLPDSNTWLQKIYNNIVDFKNKVVDGIGNISENIRNAIDSLNSIAYGIGNIFKYITEPFDNDRYVEEFSNLSVYIDMNTITNLITDSVFIVQELPSAADSLSFEIDLSSIDIFGNPEPFELNLNWYKDIKITVNVFFIFIFSFSFIVLVIKKLPSVISGLGGR